jgi:hypothetical protein
MNNENSIFIRTFGDYPALRIIDFLMESSMFDYPITDIAKNSEVHFVTFKKIWPGFVKRKLVVKTRRLGNSDLYRINKENPVVQKLMELDKFLCKEMAKEAIHGKILVKNLKR